MTREPVICESSPVDPSNVTLIADLRVHGVWQPQVDVYLMCVLLIRMPLLIIVVHHGLF